LYLYVLYSYKACSEFGFFVWGDTDISTRLNRGIRLLLCIRLHLPNYIAAIEFNLKLSGNRSVGK